MRKFIADMFWGAAETIQFIAFVIFIPFMVVFAAFNEEFRNKAYDMIKGDDSNDGKTG